MARHDPSYKLLSSHRELVADLLRGFVCEPWVAALDLSTLQRPRESGVSDALREREDDLIWRVRWGDRWLYIYLLLEFQSSVDHLGRPGADRTAALFRRVAQAGTVAGTDPRRGTAAHQ